MAVLLAGVCFAGFVEFEGGGENSLAAFHSLGVNHIVHAESPSLSGYQTNGFKHPEVLRDGWLCNSH